MQGQLPFPRPGDTIDGRYVIEDELGSGASSRVYAAVQTRLERRVALKITAIPPERDTETFQRWSERFERGARILSELTNPHVVDVYDFGETADGQLFMAMELVDGETLRDRVDAKPMSTAAAAELGIKLLEALAEAHEHGVLHRDIKPHNIMLTADGEVRLLDFGVAKPLTTEEAPDDPDLTQEGIFVGTPRYAAPEYLLGGKLGPWCDIYSLGLVLWEAVTGDPVVVEADTQTSLRKHMDPEPFDLRSDKLDDASFERVLQKMTAKVPEQRYRSAPEAAERLQAFLEGDDTEDSDSLQADGPAIDPNLDRPSDFFVNAPDSVSISRPPPVESPWPETTEDTYGNLPSPRVQQERAERDLSLDTQSIAESPQDEDDSPRKAGRGDEPEEDGAESVPVPDHVEQMLADGERRVDRWHRLKWIVALLVLALVGAVVAMWMYAPRSWQSAVGLTQVVELGEETLVHPVQDRVAPEHAEVSAEGIFRVIENSGWSAASERGEIQSSDMFGWTQDYTLEEAKIRVLVYRFDNRKAARSRLGEVSDPNRGVRFARRVVILKPLEDDGTGKVEGLQMMLESYRAMVDEAAQKP